MKYILLASLLASAAYAAPLAAQGQGQGQGGRNNGNAAGAAKANGQQGATKGAGAQNAGTAANTGNAGTAANTGNAGNAANTGNNNAGAANGGTPSAADLATAVSNWQADTSMVSNFLNTGKSIQNNVQFKQAAQVAFNAEVDELTHKAIIDKALGTDPNVIAANSTLATGGAFQDVVDKLKLMATQGTAAANNIDLINQNRCVNGKQSRIVSSSNSNHL